MAERLHWMPAYIGLGANLGQPLQQLRDAIVRLAATPGVRVVAGSACYRSQPMGPQDQPSYLNAVAGLLTTLAPERLLDVLQSVEQQMGRERDGVRWGPRIIDLDLLVYSTMTLDSDRLILPHPGVQERSFVLYPLADIAPTLKVPGCGVVDALRAAIPVDDIERLDENLIT